MQIKRTVHFNMIKMVNFVLCEFYHQKKKGKKCIEKYEYNPSTIHKVDLNSSLVEYKLDLVSWFQRMEY